MTTICCSSLSPSHLPASPSRLLSPDLSHLLCPSRTTQTMLAKAKVGGGETESQCLSVCLRLTVSNHSSQKNLGEVSVLAVSASTPSLVINSVCSNLPAQTPPQ